MVQAADHALGQVGIIVHLTGELQAAISPWQRRVHPMRPLEAPAMRGGPDGGPEMPDHSRHRLVLAWV